MELKLKRQMAESVRGFRLPRYAEIPTVGLYLEQTIKYINGFLAPLGCLELTITFDERPQDPNAALEQQPQQSQQPGEMPSSGSYEDWYNYFYPFFGGGMP